MVLSDSSVQEAPPQQPYVPFGPLAGGSPVEVAAPTVSTPQLPVPLGPLQGAGIQQTPLPLSVPDVLTVLPTEQHTKDMASIAADVKKISGTAPNFGHKLLATLAALNGQFGPAMSILEQQRLTKMGQSMYPIVAKINEMKVRGDYDGAAEALQQVAAGMGPQGQHFMPIIQKQLDDITARRDNLQHASALYQYANAKMTKDDPRQADVKAFGALVKSKVNIGPDAIKQFMHDIGLNIQNVDNQTLVTGQGSGITTGTPYPQVFDIKSVDPIARNTVSAELGITPETMMNIKNGVPVPDPENIGYNTATYRRDLEKKLSAMSGFVASKDIAAAAPITPEYAQSLKAAGATNEQIATRTWTLEQGDAARLDQSRKLGQDELEKQKAQDKRPGSTQNPPVSYYDLKTGNLLPDVTREEFRLHLDTIGSQPTETYQKTILPLYRLRNKLDEFELMLPELPDSGNIVGRVNRYIEAKINNFLSTDAQLTDQSTLATVLSSAVDQYANSAGIPAARYQDLRRSTSTEFANKQEAAAAITRLKSLIAGEMTQYSTPGQLADGPTTPSYQHFAKVIGKYESGDNANVPNSTAGAVGKYQIIPDTAKKYLDDLKLREVDLLRPEVNQKVALMHMRDLEVLYPDRPDLAFAAYFSGSGNVDKDKGTIIDPSRRHKNPTTGKLEGPTVQQYVDRAMAELKKQQAASTLAPTVAPVQTVDGVKIRKAS